MTALTNFGCRILTRWFTVRFSKRLCSVELVGWILKTRRLKTELVCSAKIEFSPSASEYLAILFCKTAKRLQQCVTAPQ